MAERLVRPPPSKAAVARRSEQLVNNCEQLGTDPEVSPHLKSNIGTRTSRLSG
jgi:hypothetical protein